MIHFIKYQQRRRHLNGYDGFGYYISTYPSMLVCVCPLRHALVTVAFSLYSSQKDRFFCIKHDEMDKRFTHIVPNGSWVFLLQV